jgi:hypothetical protein
MVLYSLDKQVLEVKFENGLVQNQTVFTFDMVEFGEMEFTVLVTESKDIGQMIFCNDHLIWSDPDINDIVKGLLDIINVGSKNERKKN